MAGRVRAASLGRGALGIAGGDNRCHKMCDLGTDAGAGCVAPETCQDVFGLGGTANPIGLCHK